MKKFKRMVGMLCLFFVFYFVDVSAMQNKKQQEIENTLNLNEFSKYLPKKIVNKTSNDIDVFYDKDYEEEIFPPIRTDIFNGRIFFDLSKDKDGLYKNEYAINRRKFERDLRYEKINSLYDIIKILYGVLRRKGEHLFHLSNIEYNKQHVGLARRYAFRANLYIFLTQCTHNLMYNDYYNFLLTNKNNGRVMLKLENFTNKGLELLNKYKEKMPKKNPEDYEALRLVRAFLQVAMDKLFYKTEYVPLEEQEYFVDVNFNSIANQKDKNFRRRIRSQIMDNNVEIENINFDGTKRDFDKFYRISYERISDVKYGQSYLSPWEIFIPKNVKYVNLSDGGLKATFKFNNNVQVKMFKERLLNFENYVNREFHPNVTRSDVFSEIVLLYFKFFEEKKLQLHRNKIEYEKRKEENNERKNNLEDNKRKTQFVPFENEIEKIKKEKNIEEEKKETVIEKISVGKQFKKNKIEKANKKKNLREEKEIVNEIGVEKHFDGNETKFYNSKD